jgi:hypothetical protein
MLPRLSESEYPRKVILMHTAPTTSIDGHNTFT